MESNMKIILIGADGQLGKDILKIFSDKSLIGLTHKEIEITDNTSIDNAIKSYEPNIIINTAAYHNVDLCEQNPQKSFEINALGPRNLAIACVKNNIKLVHISTDYVFSGDKKEPYIETDLPFPVNVYGNSKLSGEYFIRAHMKNYFIVRTSGLYGLNKCKAKPENFVEFVLRLSQEKEEIEIFDDQVLTPTYTQDVAKKIKELIKLNKYGIYHITNSGFCTWFQFAKKIFEILGKKIKLTPVKSNGKRLAKRPSYSVLKNKAIEDIGMTPLRSWEEALQQYLHEKFNF